MTILSTRSLPPPTPLNVALAERERRRRKKARQLAAWIADPVQMASDAGYALDPWQQEVIRSQAGLVLISASRQSGKSTVVALTALHAALSGQRVLITSPSLRQSHLLMRTVFAAYRALGRPVPPVHLTMTDLDLGAGEVICLPGKGETIRGYSSIGLLICEEATLISDETWAVVSPMTAVSRGRVICLFTPHGKRGFAWQLWDQDPQAQRIEVPATACPRIPPEFLAAERRRLGDYFFEQEFLNRWHEPLQSAFPSWAIDQAQRDDVSYDADLFAP